MHGLRACAEGDWLDQRTGDAAFAFEKNGFYEASAPLIGAFVRHHREDAFIRLMKTAHRHWQSDRGTLRECDARDKSSVSYCARTGLSRFEPMLAEVFASDLFPALQALSRVTRGTRLGGKAGPGKDGPTVLAEALRAMIDPARAAARGLVDRAGQKTALRNDGSTNTQVTPLYLALAAYHGASDALARDASIDAAWKRTRSRIIDQLFAVNGTGVDARFASEAVRAATPLLVDTLRAELVARCRTEFAAKKSCVWATTQWTASTRDTLASPLLSSSLDVLDAMKSDAAARQELHDFLRYATDPTSPDGTLPALLTAVIDAPRVLNDETTLAPLAAALAPALTPAVLPAGEFVGNGDAAQGGFVDAQLALLARLSGRARNDDGTEACFAEVDPAGVVPVLARALVTSTPASSAAAGKTPLEVFADTLSDVNRSAPARQDGLDAADYTRLEESAVAFLTDPQRGLEQLYQILWNVSKGHTSETSSPGTGLTTR